MDLKDLVRMENRNGARLRLTANTARPQDGPLRLSGFDSHGRATKIVGTEEFIRATILSFPWLREQAPLAG